MQDNVVFSIPYQDHINRKLSNIYYVKMKNGLIDVFMQGTFTYIPTERTNRINNARLSKIMPQIKLMFPEL